MDKERVSVKALLLEVEGTNQRRAKKKWKEMLKCDMIARGLQRLGAQNRERLRPGYKNCLIPACGEHLLAELQK